MEKMITHNANALRFLMNEDLYDLGDAVQAIKPAIVSKPAVLETEEQAPAREEIIEETPALSFNYIGENNRYFLIIVDDKSHKSLNTPHKDMLMKIMSAKKLELRDIAILNLDQYPDATFEQLKNFFSSSKAALFGIDPRRLKMPPIGANQPEKHLGVKILTTFSLEEMSTNTDKKREFWNVMKDF